MNFESIVRRLCDRVEKIENEPIQLIFMLVVVLFYFSTLIFWKKRRCGVLGIKRYCIDCPSDKNQCTKFSRKLKEKYPELKDGTYLVILDEKPKRRSIW